MMAQHRPAKQTMTMQVLKHHWPSPRALREANRQAAQNIARMPQTVSEVGANEAVDDEDAEDEIWAVTDITEDDELEGEVGQDQEDVVAALLELAQWECISEEKQ